jgi:hypothetical protein
MKKLLLILLCLPFIGFGQNVYIPDANFKAYLVGNSLINTNGDAEIQISEATAFNDTINCFNLNISNLTGIEAFTSLTYLGCSFNNITSLDLSQNTDLIELYCGNNQLTTLDVNYNTALTHLHCGGNYLTTLYISGATSLTYLFCWDNQLTSLDLSQNSDLDSLHCRGNNLTSLDVSDNASLIYFSCSVNLLTSLDLRNGNNINIMLYTYDNPNLTCINVDDSTWSTNAWVWLQQASFIDSLHYFSDDCPSSVSIQEHTTNKELLKVTDLLGREAKGTKNEVLFYIYDDGTVEKRMVIE